MSRWPGGLIQPQMPGLTFMHGVFWSRQGSTFVDVQVCHPNAESYRDLTPQQIYRQHENEKKRMYASRVMEVEQATFKPLVFTTTGGMAPERLATSRTPVTQEMFTNALVRVSGCVPDIICVAQVTLKFVDYALIVDYRRLLLFRGEDLTDRF